MQVEAVVVPEVNTLSVERIELAPPGPREILVQNWAAGVCHSDLHTLRGELRVRPPLVLGHEGAGIVAETGADVTRVKAGDHVVYNWLPACNLCPACLAGRANLCATFPDTILQGCLPGGVSRIKSQSGRVYKHYLGAATMAEYMVTHENNVIVCPAAIPKPIAALTGCAVVTGAGAVWNTAAAQAGEALAVIGCGGIGLCALLGAKAAGCAPVIGVDVEAGKLEMARQLGADFTVNAAEDDLCASLQDLTAGGPEYVIDTVGGPRTVGVALQAVRPGGAAVVVGMHGFKGNVDISPAHLVAMNKRLLGSFVGSSCTYVDIPKIFDAYMQGRLDLDRLVTKTYALSGIRQAFDDMEQGRVARGVLTMDH